MLTPDQLSVFAAALQAETDAELVAYRDSGNNGGIVEWYNQPSTTYVWRTSVSEQEIVSEESPEGTFWDWTAYISRSDAERMTWERIFQGGTINPSLLNIRQGIADIFSGPSGANQRQHLLAVGKRLATRGEELFAVGTGTQADPAVMGFEGDITIIDVRQSI